MKTYGNLCIYTVAISWAAPHSGGCRMILLVRRSSRAARAVRETRDDGGMTAGSGCDVSVAFLDHAVMLVEKIGKDRKPIFLD